MNTNVPVEVIDIDVFQDTAVEYGIRGVPTLVMVEDNIEVKRLVGMQSLKELETWINT
jgi:thioredoxin-like negative regulator of GroEL